ncbi:MAG: PAS domain S-box protein [Rhodospirillales bacterium]|jgi:two-component system sensor kinase FixL|nr:PAS domain S-box protein [Rhodospirillales bacterium]
MTDALLAASPDFILLVSPDGRIKQASESGAKAFGTAVEKLKGRSPLEFMPDDLAEARRRHLRVVVETRSPVRFDDEKEGRWFDNILQPILDERGEVGHVAIYSRDVTDLKQAQRAAQESEARLKAILDNAPMVVHLKDPDGRFVHVNKTFVDDFGLDEAEVIGKTSADIFPEYLASDYVSLESAVLSERRVHEREFETVTADGERKLRRVVKFPVTDFEGRFLGIGSIGADITAQRQAEDARRESEDLLRSLIDHSPAVIHLKDLNGTYLMANRAFEEGLGVAPGGIAGKRTEDFYAKPEVAQIRRMDRTVVRTKRSARDFVELGRQEKTLYRDVVKFPILGDDGQAVAIATIDTDVTEKKVAEDALRESEVRFRAVVEHAPAAIFLKDRDGRYILTNDRFDEWHGRSSGQMIGTDNYEWFPKGWADSRAAEDRDILATGRNLEHEVEVTFPAGEKRSVQRAKFPVRSAEGKISAIGCVAIDVTERKRAREELEKQKNLLEAVFRDVPDAMVFADESGTIVKANPAVTQCFGFDEDEVIGKPLSVLFERKNDYVAWVRPKRRGSARPPIRARVFAFKRRSGETFSGEIVSTLVRAEGIDNLGSVHVIRDVSDRLAAERRARELQAELAHVARLNTMGEMASGLAHELNQPLTAVANYAQGSLRAAREGTIGAGELVRVLGLISEQALRAGGVIRRLRQFVRKGEPQRNRVNINDIVRETVDFLRPEALESDVQLTQRLAGALPPVAVDPIGIQQVLVNLIRNAVEAVSADPDADRLVVIKTSDADDGGVAISVENDGASISEAVKKRMFDPFYTTKSKGMGLGLSIARTIVEDHGGRMVVRSTPGTGNAIGFGIPADSGNHRDGKRNQAAAE